MTCQDSDLDLYWAANFKAFVRIYFLKNYFLNFIYLFIIKKSW